MHLTNYDFFDLHALLVFFRSFPERAASYKEPMQVMIDYLESPDDSDYIECNYVRKRLMPYVQPEDCEMEWAKTENVYVAEIYLIKQEFRYKTLAAILREVILSADDEEKINLLCDAAHNIPLLLAQEKRPKQAIREMIKPYRKQYNSKFLKAEIRIPYKR